MLGTRALEQRGPPPTVVGMHAKYCKERERKGEERKVCAKWSDWRDMWSYMNVWSSCWFLAGKGEVKSNASFPGKRKIQRDRSSTQGPGTGRRDPAGYRWKLHLRAQNGRNRSAAGGEALVSGEGLGTRPERSSSPNGAVGVQLSRTRRRSNWADTP